MQVSDFGFSKILDLDECQSLGLCNIRKCHRGVVGTPLYMAPELWPQRDSAVGGQKTSKAADIFSFGVIMWEVIHGRTAWAQYLKESGLPPKELATDYNAMMAFRPKFYNTSLEEEAEAGKVLPAAAGAADNDAALLERATAREMPETAAAAAGPNDEGSNIALVEREAACGIQWAAAAATEAALVTLCRQCLEEHPLRRPSFAQIIESLVAMTDDERVTQ